MCGRRGAAAAALAAMVVLATPVGRAVATARAPGVPIVRSLWPPAGHIAGGAPVTVTGTHFARSPGVTARFASENEFSEVRCEYMSTSSVVCVAPPRSHASTVQVTASNGDGAYSAAPLVYVAGAGTSAKFVYDDSPPGCRGCGSGGFQRGVQPADRLREVWSAHPTKGPYTGATRVVISAEGIAWPNGTRVEGGRVPHVLQPHYEGPSGGPGAPRPTHVDPASATNSRVPQGTFYPGPLLQCMMECIDASSASAASLRRAEWLDYNRAACPTPPHPCLGDDSGKTCDPSTAQCTLRLSNDGGDTFDHGYDGSTPGAEAIANAAAVPFEYSAVFPRLDTVVNSASSREASRARARLAAHQRGEDSPERLVHERVPLAERAGVARGPYDAHTRVFMYGRDFLPSANFRVRFNDTEGWTATVQGEVVNSTLVVAIAPHRLSPLTAPAYDGASVKPCAMATVEVSNDGSVFSTRNEPSRHRFLYCGCVPRAVLSACARARAHTCHRACTRG